MFPGLGLDAGCYECKRDASDLMEMRYNIDVLIFGCEPVDDGTKRDIRAKADLSTVTVDCSQCDVTDMGSSYLVEMVIILAHSLTDITFAQGAFRDSHM